MRGGTDNRLFFVFTINGHMLLARNIEMGQPDSHTPQGIIAWYLHSHRQIVSSPLYIAAPCQFLLGEILNNYHS